ncbi:MAG TPA: ketopantoate reductase family protein [Thermomicrobiaceae bacterium]|nr:ketopantoate reductase family protein [Thermomicrobiaceae bacterium]
MKITVIGAGAIGGTVGAFLTQAGYDVTLVDVVAEHVRTMNERGLHITGVRGDHYYPVHAVMPAEVTGPLETVLLCVKGHFTAGAIAQYGPLLASDGYVVSLQNGLNEEIIARQVGRERTVGAFVHFGADYLEPGLIQLGQEQTIHLGELDGRITPRLSELQSILSHVMPTELTDNIWGYLWGKLVYGAMAFAVSTVDAPVHEVLADPRGRRVGRAASVEAARIGQAQGFHLESIGGFDPNAFLPGPGLEARADVELDELAAEMGGSLKQYMGIWRDLKVKHRQTEVDMQTGVIVERGRDLGIPTPVNAAVLQMIKQVEQGERGMGWDNLDVLAASLAG